ncbi:hypothetical protein B0T16DRAFT_461498 [Cercophora newfieldiana]|uniref:Zn(2)-C6 fungal-type domain-containing protein n=1 Tax=Cercophora newfieldiana TaxID=92897 RepID=A0AA40CLJ0_9PEZI|nr:hypothetical protein B0T16DRAFT_461498 [Cercophora newfieldiana]
MLAPPATLNLRYSRRSACDRCRAYKLRCQRDDRVGKPCERCAKSRLACTTTFDPASTSASSSQPPRLNAAAQAQHQHQQQNSNGQIQVGAREHQTLLPSPERLHSPPDQRDRRHSAFALSQREPDDGHFQRQSEAPRETTSMERNDNPGGENMLLESNSLGLDPMDFILPDMAFDANDLSMLLVDHSPTRAEGHEDDATLCGPGSGTNMGWGSHSAQPKSCLNPGRDTRDFEPADTMGGPIDTKRLTGSYKDLLKLSLELVEDREILDTQAPLTARPSIAPLTCSSTQQQQPVNRVLNQTARFWEIVKAMSSASSETCSSGSNSSASGCGSGGSGSQTRSNSTSSSISLVNLNGLRHGWENASLNGNGDLDSNFSVSSSSSMPSSASGRQDHLLMINLVTTYVNLLRNCRAVFTRLYHALQVTPSPESNAMLSLPSLQFGEFQLENNVPIQVKVLIELTSGMLQRIGNALGIAGSGASLSPDGHNYRLPFLDDPVAVSTREIILSQESMQGGVHGIMNDLKRLLERA